MLISRRLVYLFDLMPLALFHPLLLLRPSSGPPPSAPPPSAMPLMPGFSPHLVCLSVVLVRCGTPPWLPQVLSWRELNLAWRLIPGRVSCLLALCWNIVVWRNSPVMRRLFIILCYSKYYQFWTALTGRFGLPLYLGGRVWSYLLLSCCHCHYRQYWYCFCCKCCYYKHYHSHHCYCYYHQHYHYHNDSKIGFFVVIITWLLSLPDKIFITFPSECQVSLNLYSEWS